MMLLNVTQAILQLFIYRIKVSTKNQIFYPIPMRFAVEGVCVMRYHGPMRYALDFPANQVGGRIRLCVIHYQKYAL